MKAQGKFIKNWEKGIKDITRKLTYSIKSEKGYLEDIYEEGLFDDIENVANVIQGFMSTRDIKKGTWGVEWTKNKINIKFNEESA